MPEYLAPGVYVEEVSFRSKSIEGVSTSVAGFVGPTRYGPTEGEPELLTSFSDFERIYGGIDSLIFEGEGGAQEETVNYMAHAVRAFFNNGGSKLFVTRVYDPLVEGDENSGKATQPLDSPTHLSLVARFPGRAGDMRIIVSPQATANVLFPPTAAGSPTRVSGVREFDVVYLRLASGQSAVSGAPAVGLHDVTRDGETLMIGTTALTSLNPTVYRLHIVTLTVRVLKPGPFEVEQVWERLSPHPKARNALTDIFRSEPETRNNYLTSPFSIEPLKDIDSGADLVTALLGAQKLTSLGASLLTEQEIAGLSLQQGRPRPEDLAATYRLDGGNDGRLPTADTYAGREARRDDTTHRVIAATGLETFTSVDEISIVAAPGYSKRSGFLDVEGNNARWSAIVQDLIIHCEIRMRYRVAVLDAPDDMVVSEVQNFRFQFDSTHAALYYPWVTVLDPTDPNGRREINLPPSGFVAGIYARSDILHGVVKAPANEVVLGAIGFERLLNKAQQDILNPAGVNCFRYFEGRGYRLWGARTISSDPEWKYISVRRYFAYLEHSIDKGTQWAVFEKNGDPLWANIRQTVSDFLLNEWRNGALLGLKPEEAFFVRCDRSTMTQNDLDNGRLICLIGVAVVKPAEFVIFRIGQMTADSRQ